MKLKQDTSSPYLRANILSKLTFWWLLKIFSLGRSNDLRLDNLYSILPEDVSARLGDQLEKSWNEELAEARQGKRKASLWTAIRKTFGWSIVKQGIGLFMSINMQIIQPTILARLIWYFNPLSETSSGEAYAYGTALLLLTVLQMMINRHTIVDQSLLGMRVRIACSSLIYRKVLKLSYASAGSAAACNGLIINIMSNDLARLEKLFIFLHYLWLTPLMLLLTTYLIWNELGVAALAGVLLMILLLLPTQVAWYKLMAKIRAKSALKTDQRVLLIGQIVNGIKVIKMYAWEAYFEKLLGLARKHEVHAMLDLFYLRSTNFAMAIFSDRMALFCAIVAYVLLGNRVSADQVFSTVCYFVLARQVAAGLFPDAVYFSSVTKVALRRLEEFLLRDEVDTEIGSARFVDTSAVIMKNVEASWDNNCSAVNHIAKMNLHVASGALYAVVGTVASGKSSLLQLILGELRAKAGEISVNGKVSYASQEAWLFAGSVRENILFGEDYDKDRYKRVVQVCQLGKDLQQLPFGDESLVGERGTSLSGGQCARVSLARAVYRDADIYLFDDPLSALDAHVGEQLFEHCIKAFLKDKTRILVTQQSSYLKEFDEIIMLNKGAVEFQGTYSNFVKHAGHSKYLSFNERAEEPFDEKEKRNDCESSSVFVDDAMTDESKKPREADELLAKRRSNIWLFWKYLICDGAYPMCSVVVLLVVLNQCLVCAFDYWLSFWIKQEEERYEECGRRNSSEASCAASELQYLGSSETALCVGGGLVLTVAILANLKNMLFFKKFASSSESIHRQMFSRLLQAPMRFFQVNATGRVLNRFSKDTGTLDESLPNSVMSVTDGMLLSCGVVLQVVLINRWTVLPVLAVAGIFGKINGIYLATARTLQRLEASAKSPVFSLIHSSLLGLASIRSCGARNIVLGDFDRRQDAHTAVSYLCSVSAVAYSMWIELLASSILVCIVCGFVLLKDRSSVAASDVGLAFTQFLGIFTVLQFAVRQYANLVTQMTSLERLFQYVDLQAEQRPAHHRCSSTVAQLENWPSRPQITFRDVSLRYSGSPAERPAVLQNLNFTIAANTKVGIVGRTGAGKSSLIAALFRLSEYEGSVLIDDLCTRNMGLRDLRSKISIIPQEPSIFAASLRDNLDPLHECADAALWSALRDVQMHASFESLEQPIGNDLSAGQRQLLCLARAILRKNRILVLDEATASLDLATDQLIQTIIRSRFRDCTVLTIAHRLNTVMDSDRILVLDAGRVVEFDRPHLLLQNHNGFFARIVQNSGNAANLRNIAENAYNRDSNIESTVSVDVANPENTVTRYDVKTM